MNLTIELQRVGTSRSSQSLIPIAAFVLMGDKRGENILAKQSITDVEYAKQAVTEWMGKRMKVDGIEWVDRTAEA